MSKKKLTIRCAMATKFVRMSNMLFAFATQVLHLYLHVWQVNVASACMMLPYIQTRPGSHPKASQRVGLMDTSPNNSDN